MIYDCIIIGAGASGLFCSITVKKRINGLILEKTGHPGTKLCMSGSGQCNITHGGSIKDFIGCYGKNGRKIRSCLYKYNNLSLIDFLEKGGIKTVTRDDGKVFPASMRARDVLDFLLEKTAENGFSIKLGHPAEHIEKTASGWMISSGDSAYTAKTAVIASGGCLYPRTGSDGSFFKVLTRDLGIAVTELRPALSSVKPEGYPYAELSGISFDDAAVSIRSGNKKAAEHSGGLLFTHRDLSGPAVLNISKYADPGDELRINYLGSIGYDEALDRLKSAVQGTGADLANITASEFGLPKRFCQLLTGRCGSSLKKLAAALTGESFVISSVSGFDKAMTTGGGIELSQADLSSMEIMPGLFAIGEALDIDGITGGYNLQFAYSSARAANAKIEEILQLF